jgi:hypothetical protein
MLKEKPTYQIAFMTGDKSMDCNLIRAYVSRYLLAKCQGIQSFKPYMLYPLVFKQGYDRSKNLPVSAAMYNAITRAAKHFGVPRARIVQAAIYKALV